MRTEENLGASVGDERDDLQTINGIGASFSAALHQVGVRRYADLAEYTPDELSNLLREQAGVRVPRERIQTRNWIDQARRLVAQAKAEGTLSERQLEGVEEASNHPAWRQHACFMVFFDCMTDEHSEQAWKTRVYHHESDEEILVPGIETAKWVDWILERAELPIPAVAAPTKPEGITPSSPMTPYDIQVELLEVQVSEIDVAMEMWNKKLVTDVHFRVSGPEAETVAAARIPFRIDVYTVDAESNAARLVAYQLGQLEPQSLEYRRQLMFLMPEIGHYELHSIVLLLPPAELVAFHQGPTFKVIPRLQV